MNATLRQTLLGLALGCAPIAVCSVLYYGTPLLISGNAGALLSFAVLALFVFSSITAFVVTIIMLVRGKTIIGGIALILQLAQLTGALYLLS